MMFNMKNNPIRVKLTKSFLIVAIIGVISSCISLIFMEKINADYKLALSNYGYSQGVIGKLGMEFKNSRNLLMELILSDDSSDITNLNNSINESVGNIDNILNSINIKDMSSEQKRYYDLILDNISDYNTIRSEIISKSLAGNKIEAIKDIKEKCRPLADIVSKNIYSLLEQNIAEANNLVSKLQLLKYISISVMILTEVLALILTVILSRYLTKLIAEPMEKLKNEAVEISKGNLESKIYIESEDEIGQLASSFSVMSKNLKLYIKGIQDILTSISKGNLSVYDKVDYKGEFILVKESLEEIIDSLNKAFKDIKISTEQIGEGTHQISEVIQSNSAIAEESAAGSEELNSQVETLNGTLANFKIRDI